MLDSTKRYAGECKSAILSTSGRLKTSWPLPLSANRKKYEPHRAIRAPPTTAKSLANRKRRESSLGDSGRTTARTEPAKTSKTANIGAECLVARLSPSAAEQAARFQGAQFWKATIASSNVVDESSATGKSVITTGKCAATVGSMARKRRVASATPGPNARRTAN